MIQNANPLTLDDLKSTLDGTGSPYLTAYSIETFLFKSESITSAKISTKNLPDNIIVDFKKFVDKWKIDNRGKRELVNLLSKSKLNDS